MVPPRLRTVRSVLAALVAGLTLALIPAGAANATPGTVFGAFQGAHTVNEFLFGRVAETAVYIGVYLIC